MGIFLVIIAGILASISNFCMRRSIDAGGSSKAYLVVQLTFSFFVMILLNPVRTGDYGWNTDAALLGILGGVLFGLLMWGMGKTLERGPPGLSFAILNTSSLFPAILMASIFGIAYGHPYTISNGLGSLLVIAGLFWAGWTSAKNPNKVVWALFALLMFSTHAIFLAYLQWWAMVLKPSLPTFLFLPFHINTPHVQWFMPAILFVGAFLQWIIYFVRQRSIPKKPEFFYGILGGVTNGACTFFLALAPQIATTWQNAMLFPIFSVSIILLCNAWAQIIYKEQVNWWANGLCALGLIIGTVI